MFFFVYVGVYACSCEYECGYGYLSSLFARMFWSAIEEKNFTQVGARRKEKKIRSCRSDLSRAYCRRMKS